MLVGPHQLAEVDAGADERTAAEVMYEAVPGNHGPVARRQRPPAIVIVFEAADPKPFIEKTDGVDDFPADEQAEADEPIRVAKLAVVGLAPVPGETIESQEVVVGHVDLLFAADEVGTWPG